MVSILTPVFNSLRSLVLLAKTLWEHTPEPVWEWILVDNGSTEAGLDAFYEELGRSPRVRILRNPVNVGFGQANNQALDASRGEILVLLNSDMFLLGPWLSRLVEGFAMDSSIAAVQAKVLLPDDVSSPRDWRVQTCGARIDPAGLPQYFLPDRPVGDPEVNRSYWLPAFMGTGVALRRSVVQAEGFFDREYDLVFLEDTDLALRILSAGHRILYQPQSILGHFHGASVSYLSREELDRSCRHNLGVFQQKWPLSRLRPLLDGDDAVSMDTGTCGRDVDGKKTRRGFFFHAEEGWLPRGR